MSQSKSLPSPFQLLQEAWKIYSQKIALFSGIMVVPAVVLLISAIIMPFFTGIIQILISILAYIALIYAILSTDKNTGQIQELYKKSLNKYLPYLLVTILTGIAVIGGVILFILPGILFAVWFGFAGFIVITENITGIAAMSKSKKYTEGRWWSIFARELFIFIVATIIGVLFGLITLHLPFSIALDQALAVILSFFLITPLEFIYLFLVYKHVKATH